MGMHYVEYITGRGKGQVHLYFNLRNRKKGEKRKMPIRDVTRDNLFGTHLGEIRFDGGWRQFIFIPDRDTKWSYGCLDIINKQLKRMNDRWRNSLKWKKAKARTIV